MDVVDNILEATDTIAEWSERHALWVRYHIKSSAVSHELAMSHVLVGSTAFNASSGHLQRITIRHKYAFNTTSHKTCAIRIAHRGRRNLANQTQISGMVGFVPDFDRRHRSSRWPGYKIGISACQCLALMVVLWNFRAMTSPTPHSLRSQFESVKATILNV